MHRPPDHIQRYSRALIADSRDDVLDHHNAGHNDGHDKRDASRSAGEPAHKVRAQPPLELARNALGKLPQAAPRRRARADNDAPAKC